jgi:hypothetical protein
MTDDEICGADTTGDQPCQNPAGENGRCWIPTHNPDGGDENPDGRPSKFDDVRDDLLKAADSFLNHEQVANRGGVAKSTLYRYLEEREEFRNAFKRARGEAADRLVRQALDPDSEIDTSFARFLLERSFKFIKTERREFDTAEDASFEFNVVFSDEASE